MLDAIDAAMHQAGVGPDDPVLMSGHSQGGIASANFAAQGDRRGYNIHQRVHCRLPGNQKTKLFKKSKPS